MQDKNVAELNKLILEGRKFLNMTGVENVDSFSEQTLRLQISGDKVCILGENIKITSFNKVSGNLSAEGVFNEIRYNQKKVPLVKRIFK